MLRRQGASDVVAIYYYFTVWRTVVLCGWRRRVLEEQKKLVLACAADDGQRAANTLMVLVSGGQQQAAKVGAQWMGVEKMLPRLDHGLYVYDVRNGGPRQLSRYLEALGVMCKRKRSWSGRRS